MGVKSKLKAVARTSAGSIAGGLLGSSIPGVGVAVGTMAGTALGGLYAGKKNEQEKAAKIDPMEAQRAEQAQAEKDKYQAMVDANFSDVAKKRSKLTGRPGTGLYAGLSGGSGGLYNV